MGQNTVMLEIHTQDDWATVPEHIVVTLVPSLVKHIRTLAQVVAENSARHITVQWQPEWPYHLVANESGEDFVPAMAELDNEIDGLSLVVEEDGWRIEFQDEFDYYSDSAPIPELVGGIVLSTKHWDCECLENYIHPISRRSCPRCEAYQQNQPHSRMSEI